LEKIKRLIATIGVCRRLRFTFHSRVDSRPWLMSVNLPWLAVSQPFGLGLWFGFPQRQPVESRSINRIFIGVYENLDKGIYLRQ
jgi:hypothetical protein